MGLDRRLAHVHLGGDRGVGLAGGDGLGDLAFPLGEGRQHLAGGRGPLVGGGLGGPLDQALRDCGGEDGFAGRRHPHGAGDLGRGDVLEQVAAGAGREGVDDVGVEVEGRQDQYRGRVGESAQFPGGGDAVHDRHLEVHQDDVRVQFPGLVDGLAAVAGLAHHDDGRVGAQHHAQPGADHGVVVHEQDRDRHVHGSSPTSSNRPAQGP